MYKTLLGFIAGSLLLFSTGSVFAANTVGLSPANVVYNSDTPVTFTVHLDTPIPNGWRINFRKADSSPVSWVGATSSITGGLTVYNADSTETRLNNGSGSSVSDFSFTRSVNVSGATTIDVYNDLNALQTSFVLNEYVAPTPTPTTPPVATAVTLSDFSTNLGGGAVNYLKTIVPVALVGVISIALAFFVIKIFRAVMHM